MRVEDELRLPATTLLLSALSGLAWCLLVTGAYLFEFPIPLLAEGSTIADTAASPLAVGTGVIAGGLWIFVALGAIRMQNAETYAVAQAAAMVGAASGVLSFVTCSPCCFLVGPAGLWALAVLRAEGIREGFSS